MPRADFRAILRHRQECGGDLYDEVWDGVYVMSPLADTEHQALVGNLRDASRQAWGTSRAGGSFPVATSAITRKIGRKNFRCPDVAVFLPGNPAELRETHWLGGPDFVVEVVSKGDRSRKKFDFYAKVNVKELLLVARRPWELELYRCDAARWGLVGISDLKRPEILTSEALSLNFRLLPGEDRPEIEITHADGRTWLA